MRQPKLRVHAAGKFAHQRELPRLVVDDPKRVDPADAFDDVVEPGAFLRQKPRHARTRFRIEDVDVAVRDVVVAADHETAAFVLHLHELAR